MPNLSISNIRDIGDLNKERVVIPINSECNLGNYVIFRSNASATNLLAGPMIAYWFPNNNDLKEGDIVVLYSKKGLKKKKEVDGKTTYFYYWGSASPIWNEPRTAAVLSQFPEWSSWKSGGFTEDSDVEPS